MIRLLWVTLIGAIATVWVGGRILTAAYTKSRRLKCVCEKAPRDWARMILWAAGVDVVLEGTEHLDPEAAQVLVANHVSWFDPLAMVAFLPGSNRFVAKKELKTVPIFGRSVAACGHIFIDRQDRASAIDALAGVREQMDRDRPTVVMFPEGTRSRDGELQPFKKGAFVLAIQTGADVIPAAIEGSRHVMRKGSWRIRRGPVRIRIGEPIPVRGYTLARRAELTDEARRALLGLQAERRSPST